MRDGPNEVRIGPANSESSSRQTPPAPPGGPVEVVFVDLSIR
jgi:hypothetical protein